MLPSFLHTITTWILSTGYRCWYTSRGEPRPRLWWRTLRTTAIKILLRSGSKIECITYAPRLEHEFMVSEEQKLFHTAFSMLVDIVEHTSVCDPSTLLYDNLDFRNFYSRTLELYRWYVEEHPKKVTVIAQMLDQAWRCQSSELQTQASDAAFALTDEECQKLKELVDTNFWIFKE